MNLGFRIPTGVESEPAERGVDLRKYLHFIWRHWIFILSVAALTFLVGVTYLASATPLYTATTQVLLEQRERAPAGDTLLNEGRIDTFWYVDNQLAILRSDSLLRRVAIKERLVPVSTEEPPTAGQTPDEAAARERKTVDAINRIRGALKVSRRPMAQVLDIAVTWEDPVRAGQLANAVADAYVVDQLDARLESAKRASGWLSDRLIELRRQLRDSEEAVAMFRRDHGLTRVGPTVALNDQQLTELNSKLITARTEAAESKARADFLSDLAAGKKILTSVPESMLSASGLMVALRGKLADASQREADLLARYNSRHPAVVNVEAEKRDIERSIAAETQRMAQTVRSEYGLAKARLEAIEQSMREATGQGALDNDDAVRLRELERTAAVNKSLFEDFLQKAKITDEQATFRARDVRVITPAQAGGQSFPEYRKVLLIALFIGIGLGVGGAAAIEVLKAGFTTTREVEESLGLPVLASVRQLTTSQLVNDGKSFPVPLYQLHHPLSPFSEAMRTLRSGIHMSDVDQPPKIIQVTSSRPGEGKTTIAVSLAISAASAGLRVVLVDADLRHPSASRIFKLEQEKGLVDVLIGALPVEKASRAFRDLKLMIIPAGGKSLNPPDVLGSERMKMLISRLKETFDYVVLDTPPVGPVVDPIVVSHLVDKTVFVVQWAATPRDLVETSIRQLSSQKRLAGVVFNSVNQSRAKKYGGEYSYGKAYEKYYSESNG
jgi:succinoglycan biosynthesis transport protein ExoP